MRRILLLTLAGAAGSFVLPEDAQDPAAFEETVRPFVEQHCVRCHGAEKQRAGLRFDEAAGEAELHADAETWDLAREMLLEREMPPGDEPQPEEAERQEVARLIEASLARYAAGLEDDPGEVRIRRLNRVEYRNSVRALLGIALDVSRDLPRDAAADGFDTVGDGLYLTPVLFEKLQDASDEAIDAWWNDPPQRDALLDATHDEAALLGFVERLVPLAFRRPARDEELEARRALVRQVFAREGTPREAARAVLKSVLLSPHFLFKVEDTTPPEPGAARRALDDHELATRLSYFLWATPPDAALRAAANAGELRTDAQVEAQVRRMLKDPRARSLATEFGGQWLRFREVLDVATDIRTYGDFYGRNLRQPMFEEAARLFQHVVQEDASLFLLLDAPFTFLNDRLARHYGIEGVQGGRMRRVELEDRRRGGVLGMAAIHTITSHPTRTSPVLRGVWILECLLGEPPAPPPPDAGTLPPVDPKAELQETVRARLERHRADPACASCHATIDPLGFAMTPYDGIGKWINLDADPRLDARGEMPDGTVVDGPVALKDHLLGREEDFARTALENLFTYAVGRPIGFEDEALVQRMLTEAREAEYRFSGLVLAVVRSVPFRYRRCVPEDAQE